MKFSPHKLIQEELRDDPWKMLVACIMLNQTSFKQVRPMIWDFFKRYPSPSILAAADVDELAKILRPLGFQNRRARSLIRFSDEYETGHWSSPDELYGIGKYASDSYTMFIEKRVESVTPSDGKLKLYKEWYESLESR